MSKTPEHATYINNSRSKIQSTHPDTCTFFNLTTKDNVVLDAMTLMHPDHKHAAIGDTKWLVSCNFTLLLLFSLLSLRSSFFVLFVAVLKKLDMV
jgi:hypothetical protein